MTDLFCPRCIPRWVWALCAACLLASIWIGSTLGHKPAGHESIPIARPESITIVFHIYDLQGNPQEKAKLEGPTTVVNSGPCHANDCMQTLDPGARYSLEFSNDGQRFDEYVVWRTGDDFKRWLRTDLRQALVQRHADMTKWDPILDHFVSVAHQNKYEYPVVFGLRSH